MHIFIMNVLNWYKQLFNYKVKYWMYKNTFLLWFFPSVLRVSLHIKTMLLLDLFISLLLSVFVAKTAWGMSCLKRTKHRDQHSLSPILPTIISETNTKTFRMQNHKLPVLLWIPTEPKFCDYTDGCASLSSLPKNCVMIFPKHKLVH